MYSSDWVRLGRMRMCLVVMMAMAVEEEGRRFGCCALAFEKRKLLIW